MAGTPNPLIAAYQAAQQQQAPALGTSIGVALPSSIPNVGPSLGAPIGGPAVSVTPPTQTQTDQTERNRIINTGSGVDQISNPLLRGIAKTADIVGSVFAPNLAQFIPGTTLHHQLLVNQATNNVQKDQAEEQATGALADSHAQAEQRAALAAKASQQADDMVPVPLTPEQAEAINQPALAGTGMTPRDYNRLVGLAGNNNTSQANNQNTNDTKVTTNANTVSGHAAVAAANNSSREGIADAANKTRTLVAQMRDSTSLANNQNTNNHKGMNGGGTDPDGMPTGNFKVPADVTKRGALAGNVTENADAVDSLIQQRPDIIGAAGGRYSNVQQMIGSDDPAIAELGVRMHNIALASNGAHGVRAAGAIEQTENELFNHFKSGPTAIHAALNATRGSMQTFLDDEKNFATTGKRTGNGTSAPSAPPAGAQVFNDGGTTYHIPAGQVADFKKDHPNAR